MIPLLALALITQPARKAPPVQTAGNAASAPVLRDDGFGVCPAFTHYHAYQTGVSALDGRCHRDSDDRAIENIPAPKPHTLASHR